MKTRRILALLLALVVLCALLAGCGDKPASTAGGGSPAENSPSGGSQGGSAPSSNNQPSGGNPPPASTGKTYTLKVWASQDDQEITKKLIDDFTAANPDNTYNITLNVCGEPDTYKMYSEDPAAAADVFFFPNDQLRDFVKSGGLYEVTRNKDEVIARNLPASIEAASLDGSLWAYPNTADNGYFLYYDSSVFTPDDVKSLDGMLAVADAAGKKVFMDVSNGWYIASFFLGAGGKLGLDANGNQTCDFNNANGLNAAEAIKAFTANSAFMTGDDAVLKGGLGGTIACGVSGTWNASDIKGILGPNYAAAKLPTFTCGGAQKQMSSFSGYKMVGVNSLTAPENAPAAFDLANFLTNANSQVERFEARGYGPSNIEAIANPAVNDASLDALAAQNEFAVVQNDVLGNYWAPAEAFGAAMEAKDYSRPLQDMLNDMVSQIIAP